MAAPKPTQLFSVASISLVLLVSGVNSIRLFYTPVKLYDPPVGHSATAPSLTTPVIHPASYPGLFTMWDRVTDWNTGVNESVSINKFALKIFTDSEPKLIPGPSDGQEFVLCMVPKVGSSRWKSMLFRHLAPLHPSIAEKNIEPHHSRMPWVTSRREDIVKRVSNSSSLRFMWLRNPYSRLLSGFLDKGVQEFTFVNMAGYEYPFEPTPDGFKLFLESLLDMRRKGLPINPHFKPQSELCGIPFGMQYDFYLKVEDIHLWYPDLISLLGLRDTVYSGWGYASNSQLPEDTPDCFYPLPGKSCEMTDLIIEHHSEYKAGESESPFGSGEAHSHGKDGPLPGGSTQQAWMTSATTKHAHGADTHMQEFYSSQYVVKMATDFLRNDLERFDYPELECGGCV